MHACLGLPRRWSSFFLAILLCCGCSQPLPTAETSSCCASRVKSFLLDPWPCVLGWAPFLQIQGKYARRPKSMIGRANHLHSHKNHHSPVTGPPPESLPLRQAILEDCGFTLVLCVCVCIWSKQRFAKSLPANVADLHSRLGREARRKLYTKPLLR